MADSYQEELPLRTLPDGPIHPGSGRPPLRKRLGRAAAPLAALAVKAKALLLLLGNFKLALTFGSMAVSVLAYGLLFGYTFAIGFVILLLLHEMGHIEETPSEGARKAFSVTAARSGSRMMSLSVTSIFKARGGSL